jgi:MFS family permease
MSDWKTRLGFPQIRGTYRFLLVLVIDALGSGVYLPLSLLYFQVMGFALPIIGLILTLATFCTIPLSLITGSLVDRFGARRLTASSQLIEAMGLLGYLFAHTVPALFLMAVLVTGGNRMFYASQTTLVVDLALPHERDRWYGLVGAIRAMGSGMGGLLIGFVLSMNHPDLYRVLIGGSALCYLVAGRLLWRLSESGTRPVDPTTPAKSGAVWKDRVFLGFVISNLAFPLCGFMLAIALPVYLPQAVHAPAWVLGPVLALNALLVISCQTLVVRFLEPYRRTRVLGVAALIWCLSCSLFVLALIIPHSFLVPYLLLVVALHTLASLIYTPTASALVADLSPTTLRGRYLATYEFCWGVASALIPVLFTVLYAITPALPWIVLAGMLAASGMLMLWFERRLSTQAVRASNRDMP